MGKAIGSISYSLIRTRDNNVVYKNAESTPAVIFLYQKIQLGPILEVFIIANPNTPPARFEKSSNNQYITAPLFSYPFN